MTKKKRTRNPTVQITLADPEEVAILQAVVEKVIVAAPKSADRANVARAAMWIGLAKVFRNPLLAATAQAPHLCEGGAMVGHGEKCPHNA